MKKRFIAGAMCPRCSALDTIYVFTKNDIEVRACVDCDFEEEAQFNSQQKELPTRVNQTVDKTVVEIQQIKLIDN